MIRTRTTIQVDIDVDLKFWALLPAININIHTNSFEFEWLCLGIYIFKKPKEKTIKDTKLPSSSFSIFNINIENTEEKAWQNYRKEIITNRFKK